MKQSPQEQSTYKNLEPSKFSAEGFMGTDPRLPEEIIAADQKALAQLGIEKNTLVAAMKETYTNVRSALGAQVELPSGCRAVYHESMGKIPSPYRGDGLFEKGEVQITDPADGSTILLTSLGINLIEKHDFFQGQGSPFRIDPRATARMLGLVK